MDRLQKAISTSVTDVKLKLREIKGDLLNVAAYEELRDKLASAKQLKDVQGILTSDERLSKLVEDATKKAEPPKLEEVQPHELRTKEGKLKAFKRSVLLTLWEIETRLDALEQLVKPGGHLAPAAGTSPQGDAKTDAIAVAKAVKSCKETLGLIDTISMVTLDEKDDAYIDPNAIEINAEIGQGAFGKVYKGVYEGKDVAVKTMRIKDKRAREAITREISLLKEVQHDCIVRFFGISKKEQDLLLIMEFVSGGELYEVICDQSIDIKWPTAINIACDIASALAYLHSKNIIHRDIKSENLLVDKEFNVKLCDFGFARIAEDTAARMSMCGSFYFNAPELLLGNPYDQKVDVYSYGIVLCELITRGEVDMTRTADQQYTLDVANLRKHIADDCPVGLWKIAFSCCNFNPEKRPSMEKVHQFLEAVKKSV